MPSSHPALVVVTADQIGSRQSLDHVPSALETLERVPGSGAIRGFDRTAGDEIQGLFDTSASAVAAVEALTRLGGWRIGIGIGKVMQPVPESVRAATGTAFIGAREAIALSRGQAADLAVVGGGEAGADAQAALHLLILLWRRRTDAGWQVAELHDEGLSGQHIADRLGISASAVSQRMRAAGVVEAAQGRALAARCLDRARH